MPVRPAQSRRRSTAAPSRRRPMKSASPKAVHCRRFRHAHPRWHGFSRGCRGGVVIYDRGPACTRHSAFANASARGCDRRDDPRRGAQRPSAAERATAPRFAAAPRSAAAVQARRRRARQPAGIPERYGRRSRWRRRPHEHRACRTISRPGHPGRRARPRHARWRGRRRISRSSRRNSQYESQRVPGQQCCAWGAPASSGNVN